MEAKVEEKIKEITSEVSEEMIKLFGEKINRIILYGSYARGDFGEGSDIDFMILLNCNQNEISKYRKTISRIASRIGLRNDIMVSLLARNYNEYETNMKYQPFNQNIEREGMNIYGQNKSGLALSSIDFSKHSAVGAYFRKEYIKTGIFDVSMSDIISEAFDIRSDSDYNDYYAISKKEVEEQILNAQYFYEKVTAYVMTQIEDSKK